MSRPAARIEQFFEERKTRNEVNGREAIQVDTQSIESTFTKEYEEEVDVAAKATGEITITGDDGTTIPENWEVRTEEDGLVFFTTEEVNIDAGEEETGEVIANIEAEKKGEEYNVDANEIDYIVDDLDGAITEVDNENEITGGTDPEVLIEPNAENKIIIHDVFIVADSNVGEIKLDWNINGQPIARAYTSQFQRASFTNLTVVGDVDEKVVLSGGDDKFFVTINYIEVEG